MNNKGFMMAEVVVVSAVVLVALVGFYTSYSKIISAYNQRIDYYDVPTLYELAYIRDNTDLSSLSLMTSINTDDTNKKVYFINRYDVINLNVEHQTFKEYLEYLGNYLEGMELKVDGEIVNNILVMENCKDENNCKYAYLEVPNYEDA